MLAAAREETGLAIVTEVMAPEHVPMVAEYADVLQIGARNMQNYQLLQAVGDSRQARAAEARHVGDDRRVPAGRRVHPRPGQPARHALRAGHPHLRGRTPGSRCRWRPSPTCKQKSHLPVVVDPSHGTGNATLVPPMCKAAVAAGCDGLIVEVHPDPSKPSATARRRSPRRSSPR